MPKRANARTRTMHGPVALAVMMGCLTVAYAVRAQESDSVTVDVGACTELESPEERFACYEARVEAELKERDAAARAAAPEAPAEAPPQVQTAPPPAQTAEPSAHTVQPPTQATDTSNQSAAARDEEPPEIVGVIASLRETVPNSYRITLEDGQVWRQTYPEKYRLRVGLRVTLTPTRWGESYRLSGEGLNGYIQVAKVP